MAMRFPIILASPVQVVRFLYHLPTLVKLIFRLLEDKRVPFRLKLLPYFGVLYFVVPLDLVKDFPFVYLGYLDDLIVLYLCLRTFLRRCPKAIVEEHIRELSTKRAPTNVTSHNK